MAKEMIKETKKITHKLSVEGLISVNEDNTIDIDIPDNEIKKLHNLIINFSGQYGKIVVTQEDQEDIEINNGGDSGEEE